MNCELGKKWGKWIRDKTGGRSNVFPSIYSFVQSYRFIKGIVCCVRFSSEYFYLNLTRVCELGIRYETRSRWISSIQIIHSFIFFSEEDYVSFVFIRIFNFQTESPDTCFHSVLSVVENNVNKRPFEYFVKIKSSYNGTLRLNLAYYRSENNYFISEIIMCSFPEIIINVRFRK